MKTMATTLLTIFALIGAFWSTSSFAQDKTNPSTNQKMDHSQMMMGKMDHAQMKDMMKECMDTHKDGKMCDQSTMKKCQMSMKMEDCQNMMKETKKEKH